MSTKINNFKIGLFTFIGAGLVVTGLLVFGVWSNLKKSSSFETYVTTDVSGLSVGSAVELRGVRVGKVTSIGFSWNEYQDASPGYVVVVFEMNDDVSILPPGNERNERLQKAIEHGLRACPKALGVTGTCILSLEFLNPAENPPLKIPWTPRHTYIPSAPGLLGDLLASMREALHKLDRVDVVALGQLAEGDLKSVGHLLGRVQQMDLEGMGTNASALLTELRGSNAKLQSFLDHTDDTIAKMKLDKLSRDADGLVGQFQETVSNLQPGLANIDFQALNQTLESAPRTLHEADDVLFELKQYPSGFIFGKPPLAVKYAQPPTKQ
ncbi:MAG TPA: MlaD family protein [Candidatus Saccharimonadales bacterium]|nr:MlaD family protein [Candidatus Saccharimonadales bacterium]